jgi:hypothetical protein
MQNQLETEKEKPMRLSPYIVRKQTSITLIGEILVEHLALIFPEGEVELYKKWQAGTPINGLVTIFNLSSSVIKRIIQQIEQRLEMCFESHRVKALLEMVPISRYSEIRAADYLLQVDEALVKIATLRVDSIARGKLNLTVDAITTAHEQLRIIGQYLKPETPIHERPIRELKFSARTTNLLATVHINTIGQLCKLSVRDLHLMRGAGATVINEVQTALSKVGLRLKSVETD